MNWKCLVRLNEYEATDLQCFHEFMSSKMWVFEVLKSCIGHNRIEALLPGDLAEPVHIRQKINISVFFDVRSKVLAGVRK